MSVAKVIELTSTSAKSFEDASRGDLPRAEGAAVSSQQGLAARDNGAEAASD